MPNEYTTWGTGFGPKPVSSIALTPNDRAAYIGVLDQTLHVVATGQGTPAGNFGAETGGANPQSGPKSVATSPNGSLIAYVRDDATVVVVSNQFPVYISNHHLDRGEFVSGTISSLRESDDQYLVLGPAPPINSQESPIQMQFFTTAPIRPTGLRIDLEAGVNALNLVQTIEIYNYTFGRYELLDRRSASIDDTVVTASVHGDLGNFVSLGQSQMAVRVSWKPAGPVFVSPWLARLDYFAWKVVP